MVSIKWCIEQKDGLRLIEPNANMADSYIRIAEESLEVLASIGFQSKMWTAVASYYIFYYSLYSLMLRIGIKCEIHSCSLEYMKQYLMEFYTLQDVEMINKAFKARIDLQYYADRPVDDKVLDEVQKHCKLFFVKTKDIIAMLSEEKIRQLWENLKREQTRS